MALQMGAQLFIAFLMHASSDLSHGFYWAAAMSRALLEEW
jgi:hypothetical protein